MHYFLTLPQLRGESFTRWWHLQHLHQRLIQMTHLQHLSTTLTMTTLQTRWPLTISPMFPGAWLVWPSQPGFQPWRFQIFQSPKRRPCRRSRPCCGQWPPYLLRFLGWVKILRAYVFFVWICDQEVKWNHVLPEALLKEFKLNACFWNEICCD